MTEEALGMLLNIGTPIVHGIFFILILILVLKKIFKLNILKKELLSIIGFTILFIILTRQASDFFIKSIGSTGTLFLLPALLIGAITQQIKIISKLDNKAALKLILPIALGYLIAFIPTVIINGIIIFLLLA